MKTLFDCSDYFSCVLFFSCVIYRFMPYVVIYCNPAFKNTVSLLEVSLTLTHRASVHEVFCHTTLTLVRSKRNDGCGKTGFSNKGRQGCMVQF